MFEDIANPPDVTFEVLKPLKDTSYIPGSNLYGYFTDTGRVTVGIFLGKQSPRVWTVLEHDEINKLVEEKYLKKI